jgi:NAD(P)H-hydrate epimerase
MDVRRIIGLFGGIRPMARKMSQALGKRLPATTIQGWSDRGAIPSRRQDEVMAAARVCGIALNFADFFDAPEAAGAAPVTGAAPEPADAVLLTVAEMGRADAATIAAGTPGEVLMEAAGAAVAREIRSRWRPCRTVVLCGPGNNGGDGFVIARLLQEAGWDVSVALLGSIERLKGDAALNALRWRGEVMALAPAVLDGRALVVDAIFGAGLARPLAGRALAIIEAVNGRELPCVGVDTPSGVDGDSGEVRGAAPRCALTVTFFRKKPGHLLLPGRLLAGEVVVADIGIPESVLEAIAPRTVENTPSPWRHLLPWPAPGDHKYSRGHVIIGGGAEMTGAARLAAAAALRAGAGLLTIASPPEVVPIYAVSMPGILTVPVDDEEAFAALLADRRRNAVLLGPGYGVNEATRARVLAALGAEKRVVLDADALTVFADAPGDLFTAIAGAIAGNCVLTPHEGEFARIFPDLGEEGGGKLARARAAAAISGAVVLLKGADTVIASPDGRAAINANAPAALATGGAGDVLAGLIVGLMAQGMAPFEAASAAAWIHGEAAFDFGPGLIAEDLAGLVPGVLARLKEGAG